MKYDPFDCCSAYNECSDLGRCIRNAEKRNVCTYWIRHLSKGVTFYGKNPGLLEGHIFVNIDGRAFRISKRKKDNSYTMDRAYRNTLSSEFDRAGIPYSTHAEGECIIAGCPENPAKYKVDFVIAEYEYTIKNFNGWALEADAIQQIIETIGNRINLTSNPPIVSQGHRQIIEYGKYYGRETVFSFIEDDLKEPKMAPKILTAKKVAPVQQNKMAAEENMKFPKDDELRQGKFVQSSIWDVMWGRI